MSVSCHFCYLHAVCACQLSAAPCCQETVAHVRDRGVTLKTAFPHTRRGVKAVVLLKALKAGLGGKLGPLYWGLTSQRQAEAAQLLTASSVLCISVWPPALTCSRQVTCSSSRRCFIRACSTSQPEAVDPVPKPVPLAQYSCCSSLDTPLWLDVCGCPGRQRTCEPAGQHSAEASPRASSPLKGWRLRLHCAGRGGSGLTGRPG